MVARRDTRRERMSEVMTHMRILYRIDRNLIRLKRIMIAGKEELALIDKEIARAEAAQKSAEDAIRELTLELDRVQLDARTAEAELSDQDRKLKTVKNTVEYRIVTDRVKELRRRIDEAENSLLAGMDSLDRGKARLTEAQAKTAELRVQREKKAEDAARGLTAIKNEQKDLKRRRDLAIEKIRSIDEHAFSLYDDALRRTKGDALGTLEGGVCQSCFMRQNPAVINAVLVGNDLRTARCGGCGRILSPADCDLNAE